MESSPQQPLAGEPEKAGFDLRTWVRNSPWLVIAILLHVLLVAIMSVVYISHGKTEVSAPATAVSIAKSPLVLPDPIEEPPEIIDRNSVPVLPNEQEGPVNPDENIIPEAAAGRVGEITDEIDPTKDAGIFNPDPEALSNLPSGATGGTPIGVGSVGHYGTGTPSAFASRRAGGGGKGGGGLGQGGGGGQGGAARAAVLDALVWLKRHQSAEGFWDSDAFNNLCDKGQCSGIGSAAHDVGLTGLALLAYLGAGETHVEGSFKKTVKDGLQWLISVQDDEGCFGERIGQHFMYNHACAALAMAEAYGMTQAKPFREPAQKAVNFILKSQNPYAAWRYASPGDGDNDTSVTGWMVMVLKSAKLGGLTIDDEAINNALGWVDQMTNPATGRTGYTDMGGFSSRLSTVMAQFPPENSESMTAVGVLTRIFGGRTGGDDPMIDKGADLMAANLPRWSAETGHIDFYYWYYGTLAMFQVGGPRWDRWNEAIKTAILDHQRKNKDECEFGSWDPQDPWASAGGRIYSTAVNCLSMEVYYRYPRVFGASAPKKKRKAPTQRGRARARRSALGGGLV